MQRLVAEGQTQGPDTMKKMIDFAERTYTARRTPSAPFYVAAARVPHDYASTAEAAGGSDPLQVEVAS